jgi:hypothetical protein
MKTIPVCQSIYMIFLKKIEISDYTDFETITPIKKAEDRYELSLSETLCRFLISLSKIQHLFSISEFHRIVILSATKIIFYNFQ